MGAGAAGCVLANRLSENSHHKVLLLEAGGSENVVTDNPQSIFMLQQTPIDWQFRTTPQKHSCFGLVDRRMAWPRGKVLGGTSTINYMLYVRGNRFDFDNWALNHGALGWSYEEVLPYFMKAEDNRDPDIAFNGFHGRGGPLTVQRSTWIGQLAKAFLLSVQQLGHRVLDFNGASQLGFAIPQSTMRRGGRCSAAKAYLNSVRGRDNLHVLTYAFVTRILFKNNYGNCGNAGIPEATGVTFDRFGERHSVYARKEVIISAGAIKSPHLLMLSGIGPRRELERFGIPVLADLPVGKNLQDHQMMFGLNFVAEATKPKGEFWTHIQSRVHTGPNLLLNGLLGRGPISSNGGLDATGFIRTSYANQSVPGLPDFQIFFLSGCLSSGKRQKQKNFHFFKS